ncbi:hypothetical protein ALO43_200547 [Pseudomonas tremae]|uniref:Uncharacterized protein n=1 Tax=Pseudomonas tremae TaxID=200454 RepID=A0AA40TUD7_9PSED|nr:hypothetical protein ALO43_200547 [Pseudomonas tremae]
MPSWPEVQKSSSDQIIRLFPSLTHRFASDSTFPRRFSALQAHLSCIQQSFSHHPQIGQRKQRGLLRSVFQQASEAYFRITKLALDHSKRMLNLGAQLSFRVFDFATHAPDQTFPCMLFITAGPRCNRPYHLAILMLGTLFDTGIARVARDVSFFSVQ